MPLLFHLAELPEGLVCYDGNHRREVLSKSKDDPKCIVDVMFGASPEEILEAFENLNKSIQVPAVFVQSGVPEAAKKKIVALAQRFERDHKAFASPSSRCQCPHFNRDTFVEDLTTIFEDFEGRVDVDEIATLLDDLNVAKSRGQYCDKAREKYPAAAIKKCKEYDFWLFLDRHITSEAMRKLRSAQQKSVSTPTVSTPTVSTPTVSTPTAPTPTVFTPTVSTPTVSTPTVCVGAATNVGILTNTTRVVPTNSNVPTSSTINATGAAQTSAKLCSLIDLDAQ